jgi:hypothetical protein
MMGSQLLGETTQPSHDRLPSEPLFDEGTAVDTQSAGLLGPVE